jgi:predicted component of type VI protein secretion system
VSVFKFRNLKNGQATPIPPGEFTIGRADDAYVHLEDSSVSRRHAQIINNDAGFFIDDLGSANGTAARGSYITRRTSINHGDMIFIGSVPFRVDPEVEGEVDTAPSTGLRRSNRPYMRRDTEHLPPNMTGASRVVEEISPDKLSAPEVNEAADMDAGDLNAVVMHEPESRFEQMQENSETESSAKTILAQITPVRSTFSAPTPQRPAQLQQPNPAVLIHSQPHQPATTAPLPVAVQTQTAPVPTTTGWGWFLLIFLAGMGTGLLIGLYFARLFIEMGGKAASLP